MKKTMIGLGILALISSPAFGQEPEVQDFYKSITKTIPHTTTECNTVDVPIYGNTDKTGDILGGAIIGGIIGNNVIKGDGAGAAGAVIGGLLGSEHGKNRKGNIIGYKQVTNCKDIINYSTETKEVYSHSVVTFYHEGRMYRVKFNK